MAWLRIHQALLSHRKTLVAAETLGIKPVYLVGHLSALWLWCVDNAPKGDLAGIPSRILAMAAQWDGDPDVFADALREARFLDGEPGAYRIHDWWEYAGKLIERREAAAERERERRANSVRTRGEHVRQTCAGREEKSREDKTISPLYPPNERATTFAHTEGDDAEPEPDAEPRANGQAGDFELFWSAYPESLRGNRQWARAEYARQLMNAPPGTILAAVRSYAAAVQQGRVKRPRQISAQQWLQQKGYEVYGARAPTAK